MTQDTRPTCDLTAEGHGFDHGSLEEARACGQALLELEAYGFTIDQAILNLVAQAGHVAVAA